MRDFIFGEAIWDSPPSSRVSGGQALASLSGQMPEELICLPRGRNALLVLRRNYAPQDTAAGWNLE